MPSRQYLIVFAQAHEDFRVPELRSVAKLHGFPLNIPDDFNSTRPFGVLSLEQDEHARLLARRCILIKYMRLVTLPHFYRMLTLHYVARAVYEFYARGRSYDELHEKNKSSRNFWEKYIPETSFKFVVNGYNHSISKSRQREVIEDFSYMGFMGKIDLVNPEITLSCFEECARSSSTLSLPYLRHDLLHTDGDAHGITRQKHEGATGFREVFFGRLVRRSS
jgi:tRNA (guanine10-N2)-methyltransferase